MITEKIFDLFTFSSLVKETLAESEAIVIVKFVILRAKKLTLRFIVLFKYEIFKS